MIIKTNKIKRKNENQKNQYNNLKKLIQQKTDRKFLTSKSVLAEDISLLYSILVDRINVCTSGSKNPPTSRLLPPKSNITDSDLLGGNVQNQTIEIKIEIEIEIKKGKKIVLKNVHKKSEINGRVMKRMKIKIIR